MPDGSKDGGSDGVLVTIPGTKTQIRASDASVATIGHSYDRTLQWAHENPGEAYGAEGLFGLAVILYFVRKIVEARMRINFEGERDRARRHIERDMQEPKLPFDKVRPRPETEKADD